MKILPSDLKVGDFQPLVGESFTLSAGDRDFAGRLIEAKASRFVPPEGIGIRMDPFSLLFEVQENVSQQTLTLRHEQIGEAGLFMTPVMIPGKMNQGVCFLEAVLA